MRIDRLANYSPWYYKGMHNPGDTRIIIGNVSDTRKHELGQLMDSIFVRNEILPSDLHLSHDESEIRPFLHWFQRNITVSKPGLKKIVAEDGAGGSTISYESGRSGNPYKAIISSSDYYGALMKLGPVDGSQISADGVHIYVNLHRRDYGDILIREIFERYSPDVSRELKVAKKVFGDYTKRDMCDCLPPVLIGLSPKLWDLFEHLESDEFQSALKECSSLSKKEVETFLYIANDGKLEEKNWYNREGCPLRTQIAAIRGLAETGNPIAKDYLNSLLQVQTVQVREESNPGDMYNMGGGSAWEEHCPALSVTAPNVRGHLLYGLCSTEIETGHSDNGKVSDLLYEIKEGEVLTVIKQAQQRIEETIRRLE